MNIFKILASGHGNVSETNVSAFLGYLLNPNEDHGLKDEFFKEFLYLLFDKKFKLAPLFPHKKKINDISIKDLIVNEDIFVSVEYERAIERDFECKIETENDDLKLFLSNEKQIVDIVIILSVPDNPVNNQTTLIRRTIPVAAVFIENKTDAKPTKGQVLKQALYGHAFFRSNNELSTIKNIYSIYLTPTGNAYKDEWDKFKGKTFDYRLIKENLVLDLNFEIQGEQILWNGRSKASSSNENIMDLINGCQSKQEFKTNNNTVVDILSKILNKENNGEIDPWPDSTKQTIKAFLNFIKSDFSSKSKSVAFLNIVHDCTRFEFYEHCVQNKLRSPSELGTLIQIENIVINMLQDKNLTVSYTNGDVPMMSFYPENGTYFFRFEVRGNYEIKTWGNRDNLKNLKTFIIKDKLASDGRIVLTSFNNDLHIDETMIIANESFKQFIVKK